MQNELLTVRDLIARWHLCRVKVESFYKSGALPYIRLGRSIRFRLEDVLAFESQERISIND